MLGEAQNDFKSKDNEEKNTIIQQAKERFLQRYNLGLPKFYFDLTKINLDGCKINEDGSFDITQEYGVAIQKYEEFQKNCINIALSKAINAAIQRNPIYSSKKISPEERSIFREFWKKKLIEIGEDFENKEPRPFFATIHDNYSNEDIAEINNDLTKNWEIENLKKSVFYEEKILYLKEQMNSKFFHDQENSILRSPGFKISHAQKSLSVFLKHIWCLGLIPRPPQCPIDRIILSNLSSYDRKYNNFSWTKVNTIEEHRQIIQDLQNLCREEPMAEWELLAFQPAQ